MLKNLPHASDGFQSLTWVGFISNAMDKTLFYLDDFKLDCRTD